MDDLVSTQWLADHLGQADLTVLDSSLFMPSSGRDGARRIRRRAYPRRALPRHRRAFGRQSGAAHAAVSNDFGRAMEALGVGSDDRVVVYDNSPLRTAARGWFMLRHFGSREVAILDGGLQKWLAEGRPVESGEPAAGGSLRCRRARRRGRCDGRHPRRPRHRLLDARGPGRFDGSEPDPRPGVASGHIPGSAQPAVPQLYNDDGTFKSRDEITHDLFAAAGVDPAAAVRRFLRVGRDRQFADLRCAFARQPRSAALRRQLERVGRRSIDAQGNWPGLAPAHQAGDVVEPWRIASATFCPPRYWDRARRPARPALRRARRPRRLQCARCAVEAARFGLLGPVHARAISRRRPSPRVRRRSAGERVDHPQRVADARQPRQRLGIGPGDSASRQRERDGASAGPNPPSLTKNESEAYALGLAASMSRRIQPRWGIVSMNSCPLDAIRSFLRSLEMNTSMILGCGWSSARR